MICECNAFAMNKVKLGGQFKWRIRSITSDTQLLDLELICSKLASTVPCSKIER